MKITHIRIPSQWRDHNGTKRCDVAVFVLGPGPCGKEVVELQIEREDGDWQVIQTCSDGAQKAFYYAARQITGRIEVEAS